MGKVTDVFASGRVGNVIYYYFRGKQCARRMPVRVKQTKATKQSSSRFSLAIQLSSQLRGWLNPLYNDLKDPWIMNKFNGALFKCLKATQFPGAGPIEELDFLHDFNFNEKRTFSSRFKKPLGIKCNAKGVRVGIPELEVLRDISAPAGTRQVVLKVAVVVYSLKDNVSTGSIQLINIDWRKSNREAEVLVFPFSIGKRHLIVVAAALRCRFDDNPNHLEEYSIVKKLEWMPTSVVGAVWTGV